MSKLDNIMQTHKILRDALIAIIKYEQRCLNCGVGYDETVLSFANETIESIKENDETIE